MILDCIWLKWSIVAMHLLLIVNRFTIFVVTLGSLVINVVPLNARSWTNSEGKTIEADYISHTDKVVIMKFNGKDIEYPLEKLSPQDREWLVEQEAIKTELEKERLEQTVSLRGRRDNVPINQRMFENTSDYFKESSRNAWLKRHEEGVYDSKGKEEDWLKRDPDRDKCLIYCPDDYDGTAAYGVVLYINPGDNALVRPDWEPILKKHKLIAVSAYGVGNYVGNTKEMNPHPYRVTLSLDALATVEKQYKIDPQRRYVTGTSGGGHMAFTVAALYPEMFKGAVSSAAQSYLPSHFPGFEIRDFKSGARKEMKWIVVSGNKDNNYNEIIKTSKDWADNKLNYRFLDVPGMGHTPPDGVALEESLKWIGL